MRRYDWSRGSKAKAYVSKRIDNLDIVFTLIALAALLVLRFVLRGG